MTAYGSKIGLASAKAPCAALAAALLLAACATSKPPQTATLPMTMPPRVTVPAPGPLMVPVPAPPVRMMAPPTDGPSLRVAYGAPDFVRREVDSELWRYDGMGCTAFFFLYRDGGAICLRYSETMPRGRDTPADPACLSGLSARAAATS